MNFFSAFRYFLLYTSSLLNLFFIIWLNFFQTFIYLSKKFSSFITRYIHLVFSKYLLYVLISGKNIHKGNIFIIFVTNEIFKMLFIKRKLIRYYYFINIYIIYRNRAFILMKFVFIFVYAFFIVVLIYNLIHFSFE